MTVTADTASAVIDHTGQPALYPKGTHTQCSSGAQSTHQGRRHTSSELSPAGRGTQDRKPLPLGDLARCLQVWVQVEALVIQQPSQGHVRQLLHDLKHLLKVQEHGEVPLLTVCGDSDSSRQKDIGCFF